MSHSLTHKGFTLVEMIIYIAILLVVSMAAIVTTLSLRDTFERNRVERELASAASHTLERMVREIRDADTVNGASVLGISPGMLLLDDAGGTPAQVSFNLSGGQVLLYEDGVEVGPLTPASVTATDLAFFTHTQAGGTTDLVRVELTLSVATRFASTTRMFSTAAVLRGSYE